MGLCLSCLKPSTDEEDEYNERTSLLRSQEFYSDEHLQEELLKKQQRQQELNNIVSELSDNLIDVSTFLSGQSNINSNSAPNTPNLSSLNYSITSNSQEKVYPYLIKKGDRDKITNDMEQLSQSIKNNCKIDSKEPLYINF